MRPESDQHNNDAPPTSSNYAGAEPAIPIGLKTWSAMARSRANSMSTTSARAMS